MFFFAFIIDFVQEMALVWEELHDFNTRNNMSSNAMFEWHLERHMREEVSCLLNITKLK